MASLVLGAAGAVVGSFFGMPGLGFMIGSALGSALEPKKGQDGPRLTDLHNQNSQYGLMIPIAYGTVRIAGNVIWMPDKVEHTHHNSGKGGSGPASYTYTQSMGIQICEGPIIGVSRIWANKRLVWQDGVSDDSDFPFTLYKGTTTQLPHPAYEADKGVGNVPAHRGKALFFVDDMALEPFGNTPPSFEFEVIRTGDVDLQRINQWSVAQPTLQFRSAPLAGITFDGSNFYIADYGNGTAPGTYTKDQYAYDGTFIQQTENISYSSPNPGGDFAFEINPVANSDVAALYSHDVASVSLKMYWFANGVPCSPELFPPPGATGNQHVVHGNPVYANGMIYAVGGGPAFIAAWNAPLGVPDGTILAYYFFDADTSPHVNSASGSGMSVAVDNDGTVWVIGTSSTFGSGPTWHFNADLTPIQFWAETVTGMTYVGSGVFTVYLNYFVLDNGSGGLAMYRFSGGVFTLVDTDTSGSFGNAVVNIGGGYVLTTDGVYKLLGPPTLQSVVDSYSVRAGYVVGQYQTNDLTQLVRGYVQAQQADCRSCLEPLLTWYFVDAVESGPAVKFVIRGAAPDENIPDDDLAAYVEGEDVPPLIENTRMQEVDLPRRITVSYFDIDADYQIGSQHEKRETTYSTTEQSIAFAIVASAAEGKQTAGIMLYDTWSKRRKLTFSTPRKWSKLEPTDVKTAHGYTFVITKRDEGQAGVLKFDAVATRKQIFGAAAVGAPSIGFPPPTPPHIQSTQLLMLDMPLIVDTDYPNGVYAAMAGAESSSWGSAVLYKSTDGGTTYNSLQTNSIADVIGLTTTTLGDFAGGNVFDLINSVTVTIGLGGGALASASQLAVRNGANLALVGSEIIQFTTATLIATATYTLTGLRRGRRGTEWAMASHGAVESFVMLPTSTNVNAPYAELGLSRKYKAVSAGQALSDATAVDFTNTGVALKPFAPVHIGGGRDASGNIILHGTRRSRTGGTWLDYVDVPLGEASENYTFTIYSNSSYAAVVRTIPSTDPFTIYSDADQTTDWGSLQSTVYWGMLQIGSFGPGYETRGII